MLAEEKENKMLYPNGSKTKPTISSRFGPRPVTVPGASAFHKGVDFVGFSTVKAVSGGKVTEAGPFNAGLGTIVAIDVYSGGGITITHVYAHLKAGSTLVHVGQTVNEGTALGIMGDTGTAGGINLHFEVRRWQNGVQTNLDPEPYLASGMNAAPAGGTTGPAGRVIQPRAMLTWQWTGIQRMLKGTKRYTGKIDNIPGNGTISGFKDFLNDAGYAKAANGRPLPVNGTFDKATVKAAQYWLKHKGYGYGGAIDGIPGAGTHGAWVQAEDANDRAFANVR